MKSGKHIRHDRCYNSTFRDLFSPMAKKGLTSTKLTGPYSHFQLWVTWILKYLDTQKALVLLNVGGDEKCFGLAAGGGRSQREGRTLFHVCSSHMIPGNSFPHARSWMLPSYCTAHGNSGLPLIMDAWSEITMHSKEIFANHHSFYWATTEIPIQAKWFIKAQKVVLKYLKTNCFGIYNINLSLFFP